MRAIVNSLDRGESGVCHDGGTVDIDLMKMLSGG